MFLVGGPGKPTLRRPLVKTYLLMHQSLCRLDPAVMTLLCLDSYHKSSGTYEPNRLEH
jgi:hypothetical protein